MHSSFEEANLFVFHAVKNVFYDGVIWCLGPLVDESRAYGWMRCALALATRKVCRFYIGLRGTA